MSTFEGTGRWSQKEYEGKKDVLFLFCKLIAECEHGWDRGCQKFADIIYGSPQKCFLLIIQRLTKRLVRGCENFLLALA